MAEMEPAAQILQAAIAQKVLDAWAQNRQQVLVPLTLNLARMPEAERGLVLDMLQAALAARGTAEAAVERLDAALRRANGPAMAVGDPPDLFGLVAALEAHALGAHGYAAATLVLDRRVAVERAFLDWLAARFGLPASLTVGLARRYRR